MQGRAARIRLTASSGVSFKVAIRYAATTVAERPLKQTDMSVSQPQDRRPRGEWRRRTHPGLAVDEDAASGQQAGADRLDRLWEVREQVGEVVIIDRNDMCYNVLQT